MLLFSVARQLVVFPWLAREHIDAFTSITYLVFSLEVLQYLLIGALPDYYVKNCEGSQVNRPLLLALRRLSILGFFLALLMPLWGIDVFHSILLGGFFVLSGRNALDLKVLFNNLDFKENYFYVTFRILPYFSLFLVEWYSLYWVTVAFCCCLILSEYIYSLRLANKLALYESKGEGGTSGSSGNLLGALFLFAMAYTCISFAQRGDFTVVGYFYNKEDYANFAMLMSIVNFFCNPIALLCGGGLLSLLVNQRVSLSPAMLAKLLAATFFVALLVAGFSASMFDTIGSLLYGRELLFSSWVIFLLVFSNVVFLSLRTVTIRFFSPGLLFVQYGLICLVMAGMAVAWLLSDFLQNFYVVRAAVLIVFLIAFVGGSVGLMNKGRFFGTDKR